MIRWSVIVELLAFSAIILLGCYDAQYDRVLRDDCYDGHDVTINFYGIRIKDGKEPEKVRCAVDRGLVEDDQVLVGASSPDIETAAAF